MKRQQQYKAELAAIRQKMSGKIPQTLIVQYLTADGKEQTGTVEECMKVHGIFRRVIAGNTLDDIIYMLDVEAARSDE